jgi:hypothetical protein
MTNSSPAASLRLRRCSPHTLLGRRARSRWRTVLGLLLTLLLLSTEGIARGQTLPVADQAEAPLRAWHFAEGNGRNGFQTFFTLLNLSDEPAGVTAYFNRDDGIRLTQWLGIEPGARISLSANDVVGQRAFGASFFADHDIVVERTTTWGPGQNGKTTLGFAPEGKRGWYFAEGTTRGRTITYFVVQNLSDAEANVVTTFSREDGPTETRRFTVSPRARDAYRVNDLLPDTTFSATFRSDQDVVVERTIMVEGERPPTAGRTTSEKRPRNGQTDDSSAMARNALGVFGGLGYVGTGTSPGLRHWELVEGSTRAPYRTTFVLFNPGQQPTEARFRFRLEQGGERTMAIQVPASSRRAVDPRDIVPAADFATSITADSPIVVERVYATDGDGLYGVLGYTASPPYADSRTWYFAEGNTASQTETYFAILNLSTKPTQVRATYFVDGGPPREQSLTVPAGARRTVRANDAVPAGTFAARFEADQSIVVERTVYLPGGSGFTTVGAGVGLP